MNTSPEYHRYIIDKLILLGDVTSRAMFGGYGIFHAGLMFALISDDVLYFKVNESNRNMYEEAGSSQFPHGISYWEVPDDVLEDVDRLYEWANISITIAEEASRKKKKR
jgi:DNA transformation protein